MASVTLTGTDMLLPSELLPSLAQHLIVLSLIRAQVLSQLVMAVASVMLGTLTGTDEPLIMPVPSCPLSLFPQQ